MAIFKYTVPSGNTFELEAPTGTTQAQADFIFYSQVAAGSLVGYTIGQTLTSEQTRKTNFELSRLERDTAGVDRVTILSIITGELATTIPSLVNVPLIPINAANYVYTQSLFPLGADPVGPLGPDEVVGLITTTDVYVDQTPTTVTDTGIGNYNLTPQTLEETGYLKPGTSNYPDFACVIGTPSVWTGKDGVTSVAGILSDPNLQAQIQNQSLQNSYNALTAGGTIQATQTQPASISTGQIFGSNGLSTLSPAALVAGTAALSGNLNKTIQSAFGSISSLGGGAAARVAGLFSTPINNISTIASGAVNTVSQSVASLSAKAVGAANASIGAVINTASQFTAPVAAAWSKGSAAFNSGLGQAQGVLNTAVGQAKGLVTPTSVANAILNPKDAVTNALGSLSGITSGTLGSLGTQAKNLVASLGGSLDSFGKMSQFGVNFSAFSTDSIVSPTKVAAAFSNTVNRQTVDAAVSRILGNPKIPTPSFEFPSQLTAGINADIAQAQTKLAELKKQYIG
jgi:hypothetical protein